ncbi:DUF2691 family protein [Psychrobacillus sp. OK032]|uniref:DUF2691 family protein n=1 Tax=Psychrobacillus sp. OK032 TaxID=1884358 RepID=UPI0008C9C4FB|nr:DUF2691 family protein [Psychrobacillus sp. OK032]SES44938.1 Protein of unknown function [Psychrobacillus sp. OK032]
MRGISFEIPNAYGKYLLELLDGINIKEWTWKIGSGESYVIQRDTLGKPLFPTQPLFSTTCLLAGDELHKNISVDDYYLIFVDLKAFSKTSNVRDITTYQEFIESDCQFVLLIVDCSYVTIYAKDQNTIQHLFLKAKANGYENTEYITDANDGRTTLIAF